MGIQQFNISFFNLPLQPLSRDWIWSANRARTIEASRVKSLAADSSSRPVPSAAARSPCPTPPTRRRLPCDRTRETTGLRVGVGKWMDLSGTHLRNYALGGTVSTCSVLLMWLLRHCLWTPWVGTALKVPMHVYINIQYIIYMSEFEPIIFRAINTVRWRPGRVLE